MATTIQPVWFTIQETQGFIDTLKDEIKRKMGDDAYLLLDYPVIYLHVWQNATDKLNNRWSVYVGEANNIIQRTTSHWGQARIPREKRSIGNWQYHMAEDKDDHGKTVVPTLYVFGHKSFHKSMTLDIENRLVDFLAALPTTNPQNGRGNPQGHYFGDENYETIFSMIWKILHKENGDLFLPQSAVVKSAIYKASPNHHLTTEQEEAKQKIINRVLDAIINNKTEQLVMVEGEAGTGKTVLTSSTFFDMLDSADLQGISIDAHMLVNHIEQLGVYQTMAKKLGYTDNIVWNPTSFLNSCTPENPVDVAFIDESHLLWTQGTQGYQGKNQLKDIMKRSRVTVIMFDEYQILRKKQYVESQEILNLRTESKKQNNYIPLTEQLRMNCNQNTMDWIDGFTKKQQIAEFQPDSNGYEVKLFDSPEELHKAIKDEIANGNTLSRLIATYDWPYNANKSPINGEQYWNVHICDWKLPWNREIFRYGKSSMNSREKKLLSTQDWAEQPQTVDEVGSTFTIQGFDLDYAGVIIGPSVRYDKSTQKVWFDEAKKQAAEDMIGKRTLDDGTIIHPFEILAQHELRVLLTRGAKGLYIYACDPDLQNALKEALPTG